MFSVDMAKVAKGFLLSSVLVGVLGLSACGGGGSSQNGQIPESSAAAIPDIASSNQTDDTSSGPWDYLQAMSISAASASDLAYKPATRQEAARFLTQATFGPTDASINRLMSVGYLPWLKEQIATPAARSYKNYIDSRNTTIRSTNPSSGASANDLSHVFWASALAGDDQLRQRVALALSEIFVVSTADGCGSNNMSGAASYFDMLGQKAFGSYRALLEAVALHPIMGCYLSHLRNQKEDSVTGRVPDENFAREIMQLFSIGLYQLNLDGTRKLNGSGQPIDTYSADDVAGLAKVFTGWSFDCPGYPTDVWNNCFNSGNNDSGANYADKWSRSMRPYVKFHSTAAKNFLGVSIPSQGTKPDPQASLTKALDTIASHPNVAPFIGRQLIQRLVTSNPSPAYVARISNVFNQSQGSLQSVVAAILMDPEARNGASLYGRGYGKVREPILKLSAILRAYGATSTSGNYLIPTTTDAATSLGQTALMAPSVFNFFRPGYVPPGSETSNMGLVSPEMQLIHETSVAGYVNLIRSVVTFGVGTYGYDNRASAPDVLLSFHRNPVVTNAFLALGANPDVLVEDVNQRLMYGTMPLALKAEIVQAVKSIDYRSATSPTAQQTLDTYTGRLYTAILLTAASPEFQVQK
jgi:uncharacterized protein (DUF1800 family)